MAFLDQLIGGIKVIQQAGIALLQRSTVDFEGTGVAVVDDPVLQRTKVTITAGTAAQIESLTTVTSAQSPFSATADTVVAVDSSGGTVVVNMPTGMTVGMFVGIKLRTNPATNSVTVNPPTGGATIENPPGISTGLGTFAASVVFNQAGQLGSSVYWRVMANGNLEIR